MTNYMNTPLFLAPLDNSDASEDFSVLTNRDTIKDIAKDICDNLHHPVTVLDINRVSLNEDNSSFRIESDLEHFSLRYACRILRQCAGLERCLSCDKYHAACIDADSNIIEQRIQSITSEIPPHFSDEYNDNLPHVLLNFNRPVMEYHCPMLGYRELLFPINYSDRIIAALFVGQIVIKEDNERKIISRITKSFFSKKENAPDRIFAEFISDYNSTCSKKIDAKTIIDLIHKSDNMLIELDEILSFNRIEGQNTNKHQYCMNFNTLEEYYDFIKSVCTEIDKVEDELKTIANIKRKNYFIKTIDNLVDQFFDRYRQNINQLVTTDKQKKSRYELFQAWNELYNVMIQIKSTLNISDITIFGDGEWVKIIESTKKTVYPKPGINSEKNKWSYDFSVANPKLHTAFDFVHTLNNPEILDGLAANIPLDNLIMIVCHNMAIAMQVNNLSKNLDLFKDMAEVIGAGMAKINGVIALCSSNLMRERHVLTLRMNRHESAHISTKLNDNMKRYFANNGKSFINQSEDKQRLIVADMKNTIKLISHMASNIGLITGSINENTIIGKFRHLDVFDLLYKWQIMFRNELAARNLDIKIIRNPDRDNLRSTCIEDGPRNILIHPELFELLVYNLVDNAVKYAHRGSIIYLSWHKKNMHSNIYELTITSYGPCMEEGDSLYELYARGATAQLQVASGDGIGLYVVKRAAKLLNLEVSHKSQFIHKYHLPLVTWYLSESFENDTAMLKKKEINKYIHNQEASYDIINENEYTKITRRDLSQEYLIKRIDRETWVTTFSVEISL